MHGIILSELRRFVEERSGPGTWSLLLAAARLGRRTYLPLETYPDAEFFALLEAATHGSAREAAVLLEEFGEAVAPRLLDLYGGHLRPEWRTLEVLENTEQAIHTLVRLRNPGAAPPALWVSRAGPDRVTIRYASPRRLCAVAKGIVRGLARRHRETVEVTEESCMLRGADACLIGVRRVG